MALEGQTVVAIAQTLGRILGGLGGGGGPSRTKKIREIRSVGFLYGTDSPQFRAIVAKYPNIYRYFAAKFADLPARVAQTVEEAAATVIGPIRDITATQAKLLGASMVAAMGPGAIAAAIFRKARSFGPFTRPKVGRKRQVSTKVSDDPNPFGRAKIPGEPGMTVYGVPVPDWVKTVIAYSVAQAGIEGLFNRAQPAPEPISAEERRRQDEDRRYELERRERERKLFEEHEQDRIREAAERKAQADEREAQKEEAAERERRAQEAAAKAAIPAPLWLQVLGLAGKYFESQQQRPRAARVSQAITVPQSFAFPQPLTAFGAAGVGSASCECPPRKKRPKRRKQPRAVCYTGRYIERADGIQKTRGRRVPCRVSRKS